MGLFSEVKCGRCDRRYSGLRARCPYCGARRGKRGKHANDNDNSKGRLIIGLILLLVLIVAVVVVIATAVTENKANEAEDQQQTEQGSSVADSDGITNLEGVGAGTTDNGITDNNAGTSTDTTTPPNNGTGTGDVEGDVDDDVTGSEVSGVTQVIGEVYITNPWSDEPQGDFTASVGDEIDFGYIVEPELEDPEVKWSTSDENVFVVLQTGEFTAVGEGSATLTLSVNGTTVELNVIVNG